MKDYLNLRLPFYQKGGGYKDFLINPLNQPRLANESTAVSFVDPLIRRSVSTLRNGQSTEEMAATNRVLRNMHILKSKRIKERKVATQAIDKGAPFTLPTGETKKYGDMSFREKAYVSGKALENRFRIFKNDDSILDDFNPLNIIGNIAGSLGQAPLEAKMSNSVMPYVTSIGTPLLLGRAMGSNSLNPISKNFWTREVRDGRFFNNLVNPIPFNISRSGSNKILNKIDNNSFYRQIGKEGYEDAIKTGVIRSKPIGEYAGKAPYFVEGKDFDKLYSTGAGAYGKKPKYIFEMPQLKNPEEMSAFRVNHQAEYSPYVAGSKEIPISQGKIYRLNNKNEYEIVDATSKSDFKSEIDWAKWNPDTPKYPKLINEYNAIEESTKKAGTWMKNPDGSPFQGTPEQFIQQQSSWFKKAFPNVIKNEAGSPQLNHHGSPNKFSQIAADKEINGRIYGEGFYTTPDISLAKRYAIGDNPQLYQFYINAKNPRNASNYIQEGVTKADEKLNKILKEFGENSKEYKKGIDEYNEALEYLRKNRTKIDLRKHSIGEAEDYMRIKDVQVTPFDNRVKSAIGNVGFFDMTNPNIYKGLIPPALMYYIQNQQNKSK